MQPLTSLIFDKQETFDKFMTALKCCMFNKKGKSEYSFSGEIKTVYLGGCHCLGV
jgi:hypothetical protein